MNTIIHLRGFLFTVTLMFGVLFGFLAVASTAAEGTEVEESAELLHYKSQEGLMPPAYRFSPEAQGRLADPDAPPIPFLNPYSSIEVGSWPHVIAAVDLTGDGQREAVIGTGSYDDVVNDEQLHLFGQNPLTRTQRLPGGKAPEAIVTLDVNWDGQQDVVTAISSEQRLLVYMDTGQALANPVSIPLAGAPNALAVGDFTGDQHDDLVAVAPLAQSIHLWASSADGLVKLPLTLPYPTQGYDALAVGDFDHDGDDDIAALRGAGYASESLLIYLQEAGSFPEQYTLSPETAGYLPHSLAVGDLNDDGLDDLVVTAGGNAPDAYLNVFVQVSGTITTTPITYSTPHLPTAVDIGDLNHDGRQDVGLVNDGWRNFSFYAQNADGTLADDLVADLPFSGRYRPDALTMADFDGNGSLDVATVSYYHDLVIMYSTLTAPTAVISEPLQSTTLPPRPLDVNGSASPDAVAVEVRLKGHSDWQPATLIGENWQLTLELPDENRTWWIEARAMDAEGHVQAPVARQRIRVAGSCLLDFDSDAQRSPLLAGTWINDQWDEWGITISANGNEDRPNQAILFDGNNPTGDDADLGTPNQSFGGPGIGEGGEMGQLGENSIAQGMMLVLAESLDSGNPVSEPNASEVGGDIYFNFAEPLHVDLIELLDIEGNTEDENYLEVLDSDNTLIQRLNIPPRGDNSYQELIINQSNVGSLHLSLSQGGAIANLVFCGETGFSDVEPDEDSLLDHTDFSGQGSSIFIPAGAVTDSLAFGYTEMAPQEEGIPEDSLYAGHGFELNAYRNGAHVPNFVFAEPVTVTIGYNDENVSDMNEEHLQLRYWDGESWQNAACAPVTHHLGQNKLSVPICHLTQFALFGNNSPLNVTLASFSAMVEDDDVQVTWQTISELNNLGFNLYRSPDDSTVGSRLNNALIPSQAPGSGQGSEYQWLDEEIEFGQTYHYTLESIDLDGNRTLHESSSVTVNVPSSITVNRLGTQTPSSSLLWALAPLALTMLAGALIAQKRRRS